MSLAKRYFRLAIASSHSDDEEKNEDAMWEAVRYLRMVVEDGHAEAMGAYTMMLKNGEGVERNIGSVQVLRDGS